MKDEFDDEMELPDDELMVDESSGTDAGVVDVEIDIEPEADEAPAAGMRSNVAVRESPPRAAAPSGKPKPVVKKATKRPAAKMAAPKKKAAVAKKSAGAKSKPAVAAGKSAGAKKKSAGTRKIARKAAAKPARKSAGAVKKKGAGAKKAKKKAARRR
jgi:hypothetical protein